MTHIAISLAKIANSTTCQAGITADGEEINFPRADSSQQACQDAAATLRALADKFDTLANEPTPFQGSTQLAVNLNARSSDVLIPAPLKAALLDYSESDDGELATLSSKLRDIPLFAYRANAVLAQMDEPARQLLDYTLIALSGWSMETLESLADERNDAWSDVFIDEVHSDEENPFKETCDVLLKWSHPECDYQAREQVDAFYQALCGTPMSTLLSTIVQELEQGW